MNRAGFALELLDPEAVAVDPGLDIAIGRAGDADPDRAGGTVARQADDSGVEGEVLAAELGADPALAGQLHDLRFELRVSERLAQRVALGRQMVEVAPALASFTVFIVASADVPPITTAR